MKLKVPRWLYITLLCILGVMVLLVIIGIFAPETPEMIEQRRIADSTEKAKQYLEAKQQKTNDSVLRENEKIAKRRELVELQFSQWDGAHNGLKELIKKKMNDPESYENIETTYFDQDSVLWVFQTFTGKNAFGGTVKQKVKAKVDLKGNVLYMEEVDAFE